MGSYFTTGRGTGHLKDQDMIKSLEFSALAAHSLEKGEGLKGEFMINHAYLVKPSLKTQQYGVQSASRRVNTSTYQDGDTLQLHGNEATEFRIPETSPYICLHPAVHLYPSSHPLITW